METEKLKGMEGSIEYIKHNQDVIEKYLDLGSRLGFLETVKFSETHTTYRQPAMVDGFLLVLENIHEKYPQDRDAKIPDFQNVEEAKKWMIQQYIERLEEKSNAGTLNISQQKAYKRELHEYKEILENVDQGSMTIMAGINIVFVSQRWQELKNKNPDIMPHILLTKVLEFIPKKTDMIFNDLNDNHMKSFLIEYREKIHSVKSILSVFSDNDSKKQNEVLANLLLCAPDQELANELLILARQGKQSNDYYQFIYKLDEEIIKKLNSRAQNESLVKEHVSSRIRIQNDMKRFHEKGEVMDIDTISLPNLFLLPRGYIDLMNFVNKNPDISLSNILKEV